MSSNVAPTEHARGHFTSCMVTLKVSFESIFHVHMTIFVLENWKPKRSLLDIRSSLTERKLKVALLEELKMGGVADSPIVCRDLPANAEDYVPIPLGTRFRRWVNVPASRSSQGCVWTLFGLHDERRALCACVRASPRAPAARAAWAARPRGRART